jgi:methylated-DNA-[protein]-cysteine S-methyltransferase
MIEQPEESTMSSMITTSTGTTSTGTDTLWTSIDSPIGPLLVTLEDGAVSRVWMSEQRHQASEADPSWVRDDAAFAEVARQLEEYFAGERKEFDVPLAPAGTAFQLEVWAALRTIPYGETCSYGEIAVQIGRPGASRAVGLANGRNPISIVVPCHRVIGSTGTLTGYGGGLERKRWLLDLERGTTQLGAGGDGFAQ